MFFEVCLHKMNSVEESGEALSPATTERRSNFVQNPANSFEQIIGQYEGELGLVPQPSDDKIVKTIFQKSDLPVVGRSFSAS